MRYRPAVVITADPARYSQFGEAWAAAGLPLDALKKWRACVIPDCGALGCSVSHYSVVRWALENRHDYILIFEDDAVPTDDAAALMEREIDEARKRGDAAIRLGFNFAPRSGARAYGSHAYALLTPDAMRDYLEAWQTCGVADHVFDAMRGRVSLASRSLFAQHAPADAQTPTLHLPQGWAIDPEATTADAEEMRDRFTRARAVIEARRPVVVWTLDVQGSGAARLARQCLASMHSVRESTPGARLVLCVAHADAATLAAASNMGAQLVHIKDETLSRWQSWTRAGNDPRAAVRVWPGIVFARLFLPFMLPGVSRCIYLDADTLARSSLVPLWHFDLGDAVIGAVQGGKYENGLNSGVMLLDLSGLRARVDWRDLSSFATSNAPRYTYPDQTLINRYFGPRGLLRELPQKWNISPHKGEAPAAIESAAILHFYECPPPEPADAFSVASDLWRRAYARSISAPPPQTPPQTPPVEIVEAQHG